MANVVIKITAADTLPVIYGSLGVDISSYTITLVIETASTATSISAAIDNAGLGNFHFTLPNTLAAGKWEAEIRTSVSGNPFTYKGIFFHILPRIA